MCCCFSVLPVTAFMKAPRLCPCSTGQATVQCSEWSQASGSWDVPRGGRRYGGSLCCTRVDVSVQAWPLVVQHMPVSFRSQFNYAQPPCHEIFFPPHLAPAEAAGSTPPSKQLLPKIEQQICADARAASQALLAALAAGGEQAQAWVFALFNAVSDEG